MHIAGENFMTMIYTDNCCFCIDLKCGCILIAIIDVILRGVDHFIVDRKYRWRILSFRKLNIFLIGTSALGYISVSITGLYLICCIVLLIATLLVKLFIRCYFRVQFSKVFCRFFLQSIRIMLLPYIYVALVHVVVLIWEGVYVLSSETFYDYFTFDIFQAGEQIFSSSHRLFLLI